MASAGCLLRLARTVRAQVPSFADKCCGQRAQTAYQAALLDAGKLSIPEVKKNRAAMLKIQNEGSSHIARAQTNKQTRTLADFLPLFIPFLHAHALRVPHSYLATETARKQTGKK